MEKSIRTVTNSSEAQSLHHTHSSYRPFDKHKYTVLHDNGSRSDSHFERYAADQANLVPGEARVVSYLCVTLGDLRTYRDSKNVDPARILRRTHCHHIGTVTLT